MPRVFTLQVAPSHCSKSRNHPTLMSANLRRPTSQYPPILRSVISYTCLVFSLPLRAINFSANVPNAVSFPVPFPSPFPSSPSFPRLAITAFLISAAFILSTSYPFTASSSMSSCSLALLIPSICVSFPAIGTPTTLPASNSSLCSISPVAICAAVPLL